MKGLINNEKMKKISRLLVFAVIFGFVFTACNNGKKEESSANEVKDQKEQVKEEDKSEAHDHGYELAMAAYQCPMKCEGEKTYEEEGSCPVCKMDLKEIELDDSDKSKEEEKE